MKRRYSPKNLYIADWREDDYDKEVDGTTVEFEDWVEHEDYFIAEAKLTDDVTIQVRVWLSNEDTPPGHRVHDGISVILL